MEPAPVEVHGLLVAGRELAVEVAGVAAVGRDLLHGDGDLLQRVGEVGHVGQQHEHALALRGRTARRRPGTMSGTSRHSTTGSAAVWTKRIGARERALLLERVAEEQVVVVLEAHAAEDDDVDLGLQGDAGQQRVVRLARDREDRQLLRLDQRVEHVDHRDAGADHVARDDALGRVDRRARRSRSGSRPAPGPLSRGSPPPVKMRPSRPSENGTCTACPRKRTSASVATPRVPAKTCRETWSPSRRMTWASDEPVARRDLGQLAVADARRPGR